MADAHADKLLREHMYDEAAVQSKQQPDEPVKPRERDLRPTGEPQDRSRNPPATEHHRRPG